MAERIREASLAPAGALPQESGCGVAEHQLAPSPAPVSAPSERPAGWERLFAAPSGALGAAGLATPSAGVGLRSPAARPIPRPSPEVRRAELLREKRELEAEIEALEHVACATQGDPGVCHQAQAAFWDHMQADLQLRRAQLAGVHVDLAALGPR